MSFICIDTFLLIFQTSRTPLWISENTDSGIQHYTFPSVSQSEAGLPYIKQEYDIKPDPGEYQNNADVFNCEDKTVLTAVNNPRKGKETKLTGRRSGAKQMGEKEVRDVAKTESDRFQMHSLKSKASVKRERSMKKKGRGSSKKSNKLKLGTQHRTSLTRSAVKSVIKEADIDAVEVEGKELITKVKQKIKKYQPCPVCPDVKVSQGQV